MSFTTWRSSTRTRCSHDHGALACLPKSRPRRGARPAPDTQRCRIQRTRGTFEPAGVQAAAVRPRPSHVEPIRAARDLIPKGPLLIGSGANSAQSQEDTYEHAPPPFHPRGVDGVRPDFRAVSARPEEG